MTMLLQQEFHLTPRQAGGTRCFAEKRYRNFYCVLMPLRHDGVIGRGIPLLPAAARQ